jgi:hypothetical protein
MKRIALPLLALLLAAGLAVAQSTGPAAVVASVSGKTRTLTLPPGGGTLKQATRGRLRTLEPLNAGVFVQLAPGASVTLAYYGDGHLERLTGPCLVRVARGGGHVVKGDAGSLVVEESELGEAVRPDTVQRTHVASGTTLSLVAREGMPTFSWASNTPGPYLVTVFQNGTQLWSSETGSQSVLYDGPVLTPDTPYVWQVQVGSNVLGAQRFEIASRGSAVSMGAAQAEAEAAPDDPAKLALWSAVQDQRGNLPGAVSAAQAALAQAPHDAALMHRLSGMFSEMGQEAQAQALEGQAREYEDVEGPSVDPDADMLFDDYLSDTDTVFTQ